LTGSGHVVLAGLEIGLALHIALLRSTVRRVTVIERDAPEAAVDTCDVPQPEAQGGRLFGMDGGRLCLILRPEPVQAAGNASPIPCMSERLWRAERRRARLSRLPRRDAADLRRLGRPSTGAAGKSNVIWWQPACAGKRRSIKYTAKRRSTTTPSHGCNLSSRRTPHR
jgi:hypothetical protein